MRTTFALIAAAALLAGCASNQSTSAEVGERAIAAPSQVSKFNANEPELAVGAIPNAILHDAQRGKDLSLSIEYPARGGPYPVIIFSHGYGASKESYTALSAFWARRGYVCIKPDHADAGRLRALAAQRRDRERQEGTRNADRDQRERAENRRQRTSRNAQAAAALQEPASETPWLSRTPADWQDRVRDITLVLDSLAGLQEKYPEISGKMDTAHIGVGGDSYGAFTAMLAAGAVSFKTSPPMRLGDPRIGALLLISPQGIGDSFGLTAESWKDIRIPMLILTGSGDRAPVGEGDPKWRRDPFAYSAAGDKYFVSFEGARPSTFSGTAPVSETEMERDTQTPMFPTTDQWGRPTVAQEQRRDPSRGATNAMMRDRRTFAAVRTASSAFWDAYLKTSADAREFLQKDLKSLAGEGSVVEQR